MNISISQSIHQPVTFRGSQPKDKNSTENLPTQDAFVSMQRFHQNLKTVANDPSQSRQIRTEVSKILATLAENPYPSQKTLQEILGTLEKLAISTDTLDLSAIGGKKSPSVLGDVRASIQNERNSVRSTKQAQRKAAKFQSLSIRKLVQQLDEEWQSSGGQRTNYLQKLEDRLYQKLKAIDEKYADYSAIGRNYSHATNIIGGIVLTFGSVFAVPFAPLVGFPLMALGMTGFTLGFFKNDIDYSRKPREWILKARQRLTSVRTAKHLDKTKAYEPPQHIREILVRLAVKSTRK